MLVCNLHKSLHLSAVSECLLCFPVELLSYQPAVWSGPCSGQLQPRPVCSENIKQHECVHRCVCSLEGWARIIHFVSHLTAFPAIYINIKLKLPRFSETAESLVSASNVTIQLFWKNLCILCHCLHTHLMLPQKIGCYQLTVSGSSS